MRDWKRVLRELAGKGGVEVVVDMYLGDEPIIEVRPAKPEKLVEVEYEEASEHVLTLRVARLKDPYTVERLVEEACVPFAKGTLPLGRFIDEVLNFHAAYFSTTIAPNVDIAYRMKGGDFPWVEMRMTVD